MAAVVAGQRTVIRQLATGGVLVGGLALTYFMIMGGGSDVTPDHISSAETTLEPPVIEMAPTLAEALQRDEPNPSTPPEFHRSQPAIPPRDESYRFEGRVGPESSAMHAPTYPTTDPATFQFRPVTDPREATRVNTAKLEGTIAPPPLR